MVKPIYVHGFAESQVDTSQEPEASLPEVTMQVGSRGFGAAG